MFQLILGVSLGLLLLVAVVLLVVEMAATYPVWKHFHQPPFSLVTSSREQGNQKRFVTKYLFIGLSIVLGFVFVSLLLGSASPDKKSNPRVLAEKENPAATVASKKYLTDSSAEHRLLFTTLMKWEQGKIYCNNRVLFPQAAPSFSDWHYSLLDKDGFLVKDFHFSPADFTADEKDGRPVGLFNRCNADLSFDEYQHIARLEVVLDNKISIR